MPIRSTLRQRVVFHIQRLLTTEGVVQESALLVDRTSGARREVDVTIAARVGEHEVLVSIECMDRRRKATVEWVEQMAMKHASLPTSKLILISTAGFTQSATLKALGLGIETYSLEQAERADWDGILGPSFTVSPVAFRIVGCGLVLAAGTTTEYRAGPGVPLFDRLGNPQGLLREALDSGPLSDSKLVLALAEQSREKGQPFVSGLITADPPWYIEDRYGIRHEVAALRLCLEFRESPSPSQLQAARLRASRVAYATGDTSLGAFQLTFLQTSAGPIGAMSVTSPASGKVETWDLEFKPTGGRRLFLSPARAHGSSPPSEEA